MRTRKLLLWVAALALLGGPALPARAAAPLPASAGTVRILLGGDVMLGRGVARPVRETPAEVFGAIAARVAAADLAGVNLESPLTRRPHISPNPNALEADPAAAGLVAAAGFDVAALANNHAGDAGRASVLDTIEALTGVGVAPVGGGADRAAAHAPVVLDGAGLRVAFLAFDATLAGWPAGPASAGIAHWDDAAVAEAVTAARSVADLLVVSVHGGVEYRSTTDSTMARLGEYLAGLGVDVVWGHHPHVVQPVYAVAGPEGRATVVATSLGNLVFDMTAPGTEVGHLLEVVADRHGVGAYRVGVVGTRKLTSFGGWIPGPGPDGLPRLDGWVTVAREAPLPGVPLDAPVLR